MATVSRPADAVCARARDAGRCCPYGCCHAAGCVDARPACARRSAAMAGQDGLATSGGFGRRQGDT